MMTELLPAELERLNAVLREGERPLWVGRKIAPPAPGLLSRLFCRKGAETRDCLYAITPKRVLVLPGQGGDEQEWFLMLGLVQSVQEYPDGSGDIVFDFDEKNGQRVPRGLMGVPQVSQVCHLLQDAIEAAYNASPWSV